MRLLASKLFWFILVAIAVSTFLYKRQGTTVAAEGVGNVERGDLVQRVTIGGVVSPNRKTIITAPYNGYVRKLFVQVGQRVQPGDPIAVVAQSLTGSGEEVYPLRAPFGGIVVQVLKTEGEYVEQASGQGQNVIVRIDDTEKLFVDASSPEIEIAKLKIGQEATIRATSITDRTFKGKIQRISLAAKEQSQWERSRVEFPVQIEILDKDERLKPGMSVVLDVEANKKPGVLMLRHEYVHRDGEKYFVTSEEGQKKQIKVGLQNEEAFEVTEGVKEGERVKLNDFLSGSKGT